MAPTLVLEASDLARKNHRSNGLAINSITEGKEQML